MQGTDGVAGRTEPHGQAGAKRRQGNEFEGGFGDDAKQSLGAGEEPGEIKTGLVLVRSATEANDGSVRQDDFQSKDVVTRDAILEATRSAAASPSPSSA